MWSNPLYTMGYKRWGPYRCQVLPVPVGGLPPVACVLQAVGGRPERPGTSDQWRQRIRDVSMTMRYTNRHLYLYLVLLVETHLFNFHGGSSNGFNFCTLCFVTVAGIIGQVCISFPLHRLVRHFRCWVVLSVICSIRDTRAQTLPKLLGNILRDTGVFLEQR